MLFRADLAAKGTSRLVGYSWIMTVIIVQQFRQCQPSPAEKCWFSCAMCMIAIRYCLVMVTTSFQSYRVVDDPHVIYTSERRMQRLVVISVQSSTAFAESNFILKLLVLSWMSISWISLAKPSPLPAAQISKVNAAARAVLGQFLSDLEKVWRSPWFESLILCRRTAFAAWKVLAEDGGALYSLRLSWKEL